MAFQSHLFLKVTSFPFDAHDEIIPLQKLQPPSTPQQTPPTQNQSRGSAQRSILLYLVLARQTKQNSFQNSKFCRQFEAPPRERGGESASMLHVTQALQDYLFSQGISSHLLLVLSQHRTHFSLVSYTFLLIFIIMNCQFHQLTVELTNRIKK